MVWILEGLVTGIQDEFPSRDELCQYLRDYALTCDVTAADLASEFFVMVADRKADGFLIVHAEYDLVAYGRGKRHLKAVRRVR